MPRRERPATPHGFKEFCRVSGSGRSKAYELLSEGRLKSIKIGKRRLIVIDSYRQLVDELLAEAKAQ